MSLISACFYSSDATSYSGARFGQGEGAIYLDELACNGSEYRLVDCAYDGDASDCRHYEDAGVLCSDTCKKEADLHHAYGLFQIDINLVCSDMSEWGPQTG